MYENEYLYQLVFHEEEEEHFVDDEKIDFYEESCFDHEDD